MNKYLLSLCLLAGSAQAATLQLGGLSRHSAPPTVGEWRETNPGIGIKINEDETWRYQFGYYRNSLNNNTFYAIAEWAPLEYKGVKAGLFGGVATGYLGPLPLIGGGFIDVPLTEKVTLTARVIPKITGVTPAVVAFEIGVRF